jgi:hypothetical protein
MNAERQERKREGKDRGRKKKKTQISGSRTS